MDVVSVCPIRASALYWQPRSGAYSMTVVCRATYDLLPGQARLASVQDYPNEEDNHWNDDPARSVYGASDLVPFKPRCDVTLVGDAFSPQGQPVRSLIARLIVGTVDKSIEVVCDRYWSSEGELVEGERFSRMTLRWERAAGGPETANPVGIDANGEPDRYGRLPVPNLQPVGYHLKDRSELIAPVCFGPIASDWPVRRVLLGRHASSWSESSWHERPLPSDIDGSYFNAAPTDQRPAELRPDQRIVLENLHPTESRLVCNLPGLLPKAFVERADAVRDLALHADTLWIDTVRAICTLTWRGSLELKSPAEPGRVYIAQQDPGAQLSWADVARMAQEGRMRATDPKASSSADLVPRRAPARELGAVRALLDDGEGTQVGVLPAGKQPLPFMATDEGRVPPAVAAVAAVAGRSGSKTMNTVLSPDDKSPAWLSRSLALEPDAGSLDAHGAAPPPIPAIALAPARPAVSSAPSPPPRLPTQQRPAVPAAGVSPAGVPEVAPASPWASPGPPGPAPAAAAPPLPVAVGGGPSPMAAPAPVVVPPVVAAPPPVVPSSPGFFGPNPIAAYGAGPAMAEPSGSADSGEHRPSPVRAASATEIVELLWFDPTALQKLRSQKQWEPVLEELQASSRGEAVGFDEEPKPEEPPEDRDRRDIVGVMTGAHCSPAAELPRIMLDSVDGSGSFAPPIVLVSGRLLFPFDELETLKATVTLVTPLSAGNKKLTDLCDMVKELMQTPWLQGSGEMADGLTQKIREEFKQANRMVSPDYLDDHTQRMLLEQRHYQKRMVFGEEWIRASMNVPPTRETIPTYLPVALAKGLPMFQSFPARLLAESHLQQDQYESHDLALKVLALGRVVTFGRLGGY